MNQELTHEILNNPAQFNLFVENLFQTAVPGYLQRAEGERQAVLKGNTAFNNQGLPENPNEKTLILQNQDLNRLTDPARTNPLRKKIVRDLFTLSKYITFKNHNDEEMGNQSIRDFVFANCDTTRCLDGQNEGLQSQILQGYGINASAFSPAEMIGLMLEKAIREKKTAFLQDYIYYWFVQKMQTHWDYRNLENDYNNLHLGGLQQTRFEYIRNYHLRGNLIEPVTYLRLDLYNNSFITLNLPQPVSLNRAANLRYIGQDNQLRDNVLLFVKSYYGIGGNHSPHNNPGYKDFLIGIFKELIKKRPEDGGTFPDHLLNYVMVSTNPNVRSAFFTKPAEAYSAENNQRQIAQLNGYFIDRDTNQPPMEDDYDENYLPVQAVSAPNGSLDYVRRYISDKLAGEVLARWGFLKHNDQGGIQQPQNPGLSQAQWQALINAQDEIIIYLGREAAQAGDDERDQILPLLLDNYPWIDEAIFNHLLTIRAAAFRNGMEFGNAFSNNNPEAVRLFEAFANVIPGGGI